MTISFNQEPNPEQLPFQRFQGTIEERSAERVLNAELVSGDAILISKEPPATPIFGTYGDQHVLAVVSMGTESALTNLLVVGVDDESKPDIRKITDTLSGDSRLPGEPGYLILFTEDNRSTLKGYAFIKESTKHALIGRNCANIPCLGTSGKFLRSGESPISEFSVSPNQLYLGHTEDGLMIKQLSEESTTRVTAIATPEHEGTVKANKIAANIEAAHESKQSLGSKLMDLLKRGEQ